MEERSTTERPQEADAVRRGPDRGVAVELSGVTKRFGEFVAVDSLTLEIREGEFFSLLGPSGCGKTTTLRMIAGFEEPTEGEIRVAGEPMRGVPPYRRPAAAGGSGAGARKSSEGLAPGRALGGSGPQAPQGDAARAKELAA